MCGSGFFLTKSLLSFEAEFLTKFAIENKDISLVKRLTSDFRLFNILLM